MMNISEIINEAIVRAQQYTPHQVKVLETLRDKIRCQQLKVTVLGNFKAGKSTIINKLFLHDNLLPTDYSECTAVPTQIAAGPRKLQLWKRERNGSESLVEETTDFSADTLTKLITAASAEERTAKAQRFSRAVLTMPDVLPEHLCLVDTPGLDSDNQGIIVGTMAEAHDADALLYVVKEKTIDAKERKMLLSMCGMQTPKLPVFIVVTYDSSVKPISQVRQICAQNIAALQSVGIPAICAPYAFGSDTTNAAPVADFSDFSAPTSSGFDDWFDDAPASTSSPDSAPSPSSVSEGDLGQQLHDFFVNEVQPGRIAKIMRELKPLLAEQLMTLRTRAEISQTESEKIVVLEEQLRKQRFEYNRRVELLLGDVQALNIQYKRKVTLEINNIVRSKKASLEPLSNIQQVSAALKSWNNDIPEEISDEMQLLRLEWTRNVRDMLFRHGEEMKDSLQSAPESTIEFSAGLLSKVPAWLVLVGDYALTQFLSPLPLLIDLPLRYFFGDLPFLPANIAASLAKKMACNNLDEAKDKILQDVSASLTDMTERMVAELRSKLAAGDYFAATETALTDAREHQLGPSEAEQIQQTITTLEHLLNTL